MDPIGTTASLITIGEIVKEVKEFCGKVKCAPKEFERYVDYLELIHQPREIVERCNAALEIVRKEARDLLDNYEHVKRQRSNQIWMRFRILWDWCKFVINEDTIKSLIQAVEHAKSTLYLALDATILARTVSGHQGIQTCIQDLMKQMAAQSEVLNQVHKASQLVRNCDRLYVPAQEADSTTGVETCSLSSTTRGKRIAQTFNKSVERIKVAVTTPKKKRNGKHKTKSVKGETVGTAHDSRSDAVPNEPDPNSLSHLLEEEDESGAPVEWRPDNHEEGGFIIFNGDQCDLIVDLESNAFGLSATTDGTSAVELETEGDIANTNYAPPLVEDFEDELDVNENYALVNTDVRWLVVIYVQPTVEDIEDEIDENYLPLDPDLPSVLEPVSSGGSSPPSIELEIPQADLEPAAPSQEGVYGGPRDHINPGQENVERKGRLQERWHGEDLGRDLGSRAQNGCRYDPDAWGSSLQRLGGRFLECLDTLHREGSNQPGARGFFREADSEAWVPVPRPSLLESILLPPILNAALYYKIFNS
ncbi:hypothetical protein BDZ45DRAFT_746759 [Acephala macrosclerotiorum]|nr:hypothetical protein BDZ45DRAFT_746759 [Acephala macrosclerotiorum]